MITMACCETGVNSEGRFGAFHVAQLGYELITDGGAGTLFSEHDGSREEEGSRELRAFK